VGSSLFHLARCEAEGRSERFWCTKKNGFLQNPFQMYDIDDIAEVVYCCFTLYNMAVEERVSEAEYIPESADFYECIEDEDEVAEAHGTLSAMAFVQEEDDNLADRHLEIGRLSQLGIDVYHPTLCQRELDAAVLDISTRLAHHPWKALYDYAEHKHLQPAIIVQLREKYTHVA
jgi:hypothetical protein